jgi:hypothetical protein
MLRVCSRPTPWHTIPRVRRQPASQLRHTTDAPRDGAGASECARRGHDTMPVVRCLARRLAVARGAVGRINESVTHEPAACAAPTGPALRHGAMRPTWFATLSMNQRLPSGPLVMAYGPLPAVGIGNAVMVPLGVIRPILLPKWVDFEALSTCVRPVAAALGVR